MPIQVSPPPRPGAPASVDPVLRPAGPFLGALNQFLLEQTKAFERELRDIISFALAHSGKRLRPVLVFFSGSRDMETFGEELVRAAAVVELVHLATLVHDDVLDDADLRHRQETVARRFGVSAAVLAGDALFAQALRLASDFPTTVVCRLVSEATRRVCAGEIEQTFNRLGPCGDLESYFRIIERKTAELFKVSCALGMVLRAPERGDCFAAASDYGRHLGLAYQIYDDLIDVFGNEDQVGKTLGTDYRAGKLTLPLLLLAGDLEVEGRDPRWIFESEEEGVLRREMLRRDIPARVFAHFRRELSKARARVAGMESGDGGLALHALLDSVDRRMGSILD